MLSQKLYYTWQMVEKDSPQFWDESFRLKTQMTY